MRRDLAIALGSPAPWLAAAVAALIVGHSFVLAIDLYTAASRSVEAGALMAREFDPLLGVTRPTYGGAAFCLTLVGPLVAARVLAVEAERHTLQARLLAVASPLRLLAAKITAAWLALAVFMVPVVFTMALWVGSGGHLGLAELATLLAGGLLHALFLACVSTAAAAWTRGVTPAATLALAASLGDTADQRRPGAFGSTPSAAMRAASAGPATVPYPAEPLASSSCEPAPRTPARERKPRCPTSTKPSSPSPA
jgi:ABC-2 type transport system permease protein